MEKHQEKPAAAGIKCVVWDLDNTLWNGTLLEDDHVTPHPHITDAIKELDARGILHSIASRNDPATAMAQLERLGLAEYFLHPRIGWGTKSAAVAEIGQALNISLDTVAFVDDQPFEREEVAFRHPQVRCLDPGEVHDAVTRWAEFQPRFITDESRRRRHLYRSSIEREQAEQDADAVGDDFLATLGMVFSITRAGEEDLRRAEELTVRTNQLNSTGHTYSYDELKELLRSPHHLLLVAELSDRFGTYGKIGLALVETRAEVWTLRLLLMSCRVMSRGVGTVLLHHVMGLARDGGVRLQAEFTDTGRNRMMYITYRLAGFTEVPHATDLLETDLRLIPPPPQHLTLNIP
ncbi:HAD-IIIC family phosphatase [Streptomyces sp. NPDC001985]|uniref:HAD-IIIC family phosphatase n=1 Tax=Streptomyces sp. NPDC001985 TaxID=3154406 RepID=UPI00331FFBFB